MEVIIRKSTKNAVHLAAQLIADAVAEKPKITLGLANGITMSAVYSRLAAIHRKLKLNFSKVTTFNMNEYVGVPPEDVNSFHHYMDHYLFDHININKKNTHLPNGIAIDEAAECEQYEKAIRKAGGIDLQLLGLGHDGHIGFNEPLSSFNSRTRVKNLTPVTVAEKSRYFNPPELMPRRAFTMGIGTILEARRLIMLVTGAGKADITAKALEGPLCSMTTGSAIQLHPNAVVILDEAAAAKLTLRDYYQYIWDNEPKWDKYHNF